MYYKIVNQLYSLITIIKRFIIPPYCLHCGIFDLSVEKIWCSTCSRLVRSVVSATISVTPGYQMPVFSVGAYEGPLKNLIIAKSWSSFPASISLGELIWMKTPVSVIEVDYIVPIPLHWRRYAWRGYNQAEVIAQVISVKTGKPIIPLIKRVRNTSFQSSLPKDQRYANVAEAFEFVHDYKLLKGGRFLLVDDLMTTGATLKQCGQLIARYTEPLSICAVVAGRAC